MPCHLHGLPESTLPHDSTYDSDFCLECFQQSLETNRGFYQYLDEEDGRVVETDGNTQQSHEQSYWSPSSHEYEDVSEPKNRSDDGDSTEACRASDDTCKKSFLRLPSRDTYLTRFRSFCRHTGLRHAYFFV